MLRLYSRPFLQGIKAVLPLWLASAPFAIAYALAARQSGLSILDTELMSLTVYSGAAQMSIIQLLSDRASLLLMLLTALALNLHHILYGLSLARRIEFSRLERALASYLLTDSVYGVTIVAGTSASFSWLFGAGLSLFVAWNVFTAAGILIGHLLIIPATAHLDLVAPLTFSALLVSVLRSKLDILVAIVSAIGAILCLSLHLGSGTILVVGILGALIGAWLAERRQHGPAGPASKAERP